MVILCILLMEERWGITKIIHSEQVFPFLKECVNSMFSTLVLVNISAKMSKSVQCHKVRYMEVNGQSKYR